MPTPKTITVPLAGRIVGGESLEFLRLEKAARPTVPFALIRYAIDGEEQPLGLRMDLDKRAFLDHFEDQAKDALLERAALQIVDLMSDEDPPQGDFQELRAEIDRFRHEVDEPSAHPEEESIPEDVAEQIRTLYLPMAVGRDVWAKRDALDSLRAGWNDNRDHGQIQQWARAAVSLAVYVLKPESLDEMEEVDIPKAIGAIFRFSRWTHTENNLRKRFQPYAQSVVSALWGGMERW
jgi:hypothetical protein